MIVGRKHVYEKALKIPAGVEGDFEVSHVNFEAGTSLPLANTRTILLGGDNGGSVEFKKATRWHQIAEKGALWMTDLPIEQAQHDVALREFRHGSILIGGLGLGYAVTVVARRPGVRRVVVIEKAPEVVRLVAAATRRNLGRENAAKVTFVTADLFDYLREQSHNTHDTPFERAFYDIWTSDSETTFHDVVVPLIQQSKFVVKRQPVCWNENVMRGQLRHALMSRWTAPKLGVSDASYEAMSKPYAGSSKSTAKYWDWAVPFWRWFIQAERSDEEFHAAADLYAGMYGGWDWERNWEMVILLHADHLGPLTLAK